MDYPSVLIDRDISWLSFNERVLLEAERPYTPLIEKLRFLAIYSSNLDEFYRVRVAAFQRAAENADEESEQYEELRDLLQKIHDIVDEQQVKFGDIYRRVVLPQMAKQKVRIWQGESLDIHQEKCLTRYFQTHARGFIHFQEGTVFLENRKLYLAVSLAKNQGTQRIVFVNIPEELSRFVSYPATEGKAYMFLDDLIRMHLPLLFPEEIVRSAYSVKMNRDAELYLEEEYRGDLKEQILNSLSKRSDGAPSRLLVDEKMPEDLRKKVEESIGLDSEMFIDGGRYHNFSDFFDFENPVGTEWEYPVRREVRVAAIENADSILDLIEERDQLLHFPYQSYDYVLRLFNEAATDGSVTEIRATMYRMSSSSAIAKALINAARNGKKVVVFVELKARFDEVNNIRWSEKMQEAGVKIIYSIPDIKVHAKVALFTREKDGRKSRIAFYGTGNFNEKTAAIYADHALLTSNANINEELDRLLKYLDTGDIKPDPKHLLIAGFNINERFFHFIDREIDFAKSGQEAEIFVKINNLEDESIIRKLYEAAEAGVRIKLIVRGICCLNPEVNKNIEVRRVVGRYLEHGRVFCFNNGGEKEIYSGSADWMSRNLHRRIEVVFPLVDEKLFKEMEDYLDIQWSAHRGTVVLDGELNNLFAFDEESDVSAQEDFYQMLKSREEVKTELKKV
jgi:polyphosphate kinase